MKLRFQILLSSWLMIPFTLHAHSFVHNNNHEEISEESSYLEKIRDLAGAGLNIAGFLHSAEELSSFNPYLIPKSKLADGIRMFTDIDYFYMLSFIGFLDLMDVYGHSVEFLSYASDLTGIEKLKYFEKFMISPHVLVVNSVGIAHHILREIYLAQGDKDWSRLRSAHNILGCTIHGFNILTYMISADKKPTTKTLEPSEDSL